jgi:serine/threonine protein kinase
VIPQRIGNYAIGDEIGHGSFGSVFKATNTNDRKTYAIKAIPRSKLRCDEDREHFQREINAMAFLRHDNLLALRDFLSDEGHFYLVLDFCEEGELYSVVAQDDRLDEPTAALIFQQILSAVAYCHSFSVAHRDLKLENILIVRFPQIKVSDFGLCGFMENEQLLRTFCGSPAYCAPECLSKLAYDGEKSDIWSLGVVLYSMVTGDFPWNIANASIMIRHILRGTFVVPSDVSPLCRDVIEGCLKVDPAQRMPMARMLIHPWLQCAGRSPHYEAVPRPSLELPQKQTKSLKQLSEEGRGAGKATFQDIISPFASGDVQWAEGPVRLWSRAASSKEVCEAPVTLPGAKKGAPTLNYGSARDLLRRPQKGNCLRYAPMPKIKEV